MARDRMKAFPVPGDTTPESLLCGELVAALAPARGDKAATADLWDENWRLVYALADAVMDRTVAEFR